MQVPLITTAFGASQHVGSVSRSQTPTSGSSRHSPYGPHTTVSSPSHDMSRSQVRSTARLGTPVAAYNPQDWNRQPANDSAVVSNSRRVSGPALGVRNLTGGETLMPSPPPPYSPRPDQTQFCVSPSGSARGRVGSLDTSGQSLAVALSGSPATPAGSFERARFPNNAVGALNGIREPVQGCALPPPPRRENATPRNENGTQSSHFNEPGSRRRTVDMGQNASLPSTQIPSGAITPYQDLPPHSEINPPAARRAVSTGAISNSDRMQSHESTSVSSTQRAWEPGMPLPPPPPGPPPGAARSQSVTGASSTGSADLDAPECPNRPPMSHGKSAQSRIPPLTPIPPTPAGWTDSAGHPRSNSLSENVRLDPASVAARDQMESLKHGEVESSSPQMRQNTASSLPNASLSRTPARRGPSAGGIRERRSVARALKERSTVGSASKEYFSESKNPDSESTPKNLFLLSPRSSMSRENVLQRGHAGYILSREEMQTPESSQNHRKRPALYEKHFLSSAPTQTESSASEAPVMIHTQSEDRSGRSSVVGAALFPPTSSVSDPCASGRMFDFTSSHAGLETKSQAERSAFKSAAIERHSQFVEREFAASSDQERLELFTEFIVHESRLRRDWLSAAFDTMASDILDLTRDMWRPFGSPTKPIKVRIPSPTPPASQSISSASIPLTDGRSAVMTSPSNASTQLTPVSERISPESTVNMGRALDETNLRSGFQPSLSPIPSMAVSTRLDELESRGRSASRWWEASAEGSVGRVEKIERTKREAKYMGLPKEARETLQWTSDHPSPVPSVGTRSNPIQQMTSSGLDEYPPEKVGWHEPERLVPTPYGSAFGRSVPNTPDPRKLDVSRLVTLPPPFPRHYPALSNSHPELSSIRSIHRTLSDLEEAKDIRERHASRQTALTKQNEELSGKERDDFETQIRIRTQGGELQRVEAADAVRVFDERNVKRKQDEAQAAFKEFQRGVMGPLHAWFSERIVKAAASIDQINGMLVDEAEHPSPNQAQEEGDEKAELLEKLTLLKWLFELKEQLHLELFGLQQESDRLYKRVVLTPYELTGNLEKKQEAEVFFARDGRERTLKFEQEVLERWEAFHKVVEENVTRGVQVQLGAFWDIAPSLREVINTVHGFDLSTLDLLIPPDEYEENPSYLRYPLQYLYSLLVHAEKSTYQFIESQTNLMCFLHEVETRVMRASSRVLEGQRCFEDGDEGEMAREMEGVREDEERRLTELLKEKVSLVEGQWDEAVGRSLEECKGRVAASLMESGGWDESLEE